MKSTLKRSDQPLDLSGSFAVAKYECQGAIVREGLSQLTEIRAELYSDERQHDINDFLGKAISVRFKTEGGKIRKFSGVIISAEDLGISASLRHFVVEARPWFWMLTLARNNRIFQNKSTNEIIEEVIKAHGFSDFKNSTSSAGTQKRDYCVQYRESDYDFLCRLMEEEGIYFYFDSDAVTGDTCKLILADGIGAHSDLPETPKPEFQAGRMGRMGNIVEYVSKFEAHQRVTPGKVELRDFGFENPKPQTARANTTLQDRHDHKAYEIYENPGHFGKETQLGATRARVRMEAEEARHSVMQGGSNLKTLGVGRVFSFDAAQPITFDHKGKAFLVTQATHYMRNVSVYGGRGSGRSEAAQPKSALEYPDDLAELYANSFEVVPKTVPYRAPLVTPWPEIPGLQTALVVGKAGEEIWTDAHGRIKVQFHWDRVGKNDENASCWVRVVTPWSGRGWGMIAVPRIGQEVVIQFEHGDPDRPLCTGMLYNAETKPPYELPANATQSGVKTNSSKGGGGFNELMFEDKKGEELVRFQSEKNYEQIVKNDAKITVGADKKDPGSMVLTVHKDLTETVSEGNHSFTVTKGTQTQTVEGDRSDTVKTGNFTTEVNTGNMETTVKTGNMATTVSTGNATTTVKTGNLTVDVSLGKIEISAMQSIELKVGASSIKIEPAQITMKSPMVKIEAEGMLEAKSPLTTVKGDGVLTLKGGITLIN